MSSSQHGAFTPEERKGALWALLIAGVIAFMALLFQQSTQPSLGPWGAEQASVAMPDVLDAQPVGSSL